MKRKNKFKFFSNLTVYFSLSVFLILLATLSLLLFLFYFLNEVGWLTLNTRTGLFPLFMILAISSVIIGTVFATIFSRIPLRPFREIIEAMNRVAQGDYDVKLDYESPNELKQFSQSFNTMTKELGNTEILRSDFINSFSHEFKTPIISIKGFTSLLKNQNLSDEERDEYLNIIIEESERLTELSTNVLNLTKLENTEILTGLEPCNLAEEIRRCLVLLESRWEKKNLTMDLTLPDISVLGNADLLQQVWLNLLDNAIKFSLNDGTIHIILIETEQFVSVIIKDEGVGMSEDQTRNIFRKFYQTDEGQKAGGNGLGLSLVKRILELHHGHIFVESEVKKGTSFTVSLPKRKPNTI